MLRDYSVFKSKFRQFRINFRSKLQALLFCENMGREFSFAHWTTESVKAINLTMHRLQKKSRGLLLHETTTVLTTK